jgi:PAS domain S-box-containing protein
VLTIINAFYSLPQYVIIGLVYFLLLSMLVLIVLIYWNKNDKSMKKGLHYREELFHTLYTHIDDVFVIYQVKTHKFEYISPNLEKILGLSLKSIEKDPFFLLKYTNLPGKEELYTYFSNTALGNDYEMEGEMIHPITHQKRWINFHLYPSMKQDEVNRYVIRISDITKEKQTQQVLKDALLSVQKANEAKKEFLSHISHELRTPINSILGMAQVASNSLEDKEKMENCLDKITYSSKNLLSLINNILDMSRIDSDKLLLTKEPFHLQQLIYALATLIRNQADINHQEFHLVKNYHNDYIIGDSLRLHQILENCLSNALKFTSTNGKIELEIKEIERFGNKSLYRFIISDNGKGMSQEYIERIFIPFEQEDSSIARKYGGSGLGMSIVQNLVTLMGGNIRISSQIGIGTIVTIDIVFEVFMENQERYSLELKEDNSEIEDISGHRVLVIEDNLINMEITCEFLKYANLSVETATNGKDAIELFENSEKGFFDVILMDVQMPELNGFETAKAIRRLSHPDAGSICIIAMTANVYQEDISLLLDCGMNYHIPKPIDIDQLHKIVRKAIKKQ